MKMKKILFLHGFFATGQCIPALTLRKAFECRAQVLTPDLPLHPAEALACVKRMCHAEKPDVIVGNSCGSFYAQMAASELEIKALLGNPHFQMTDFLSTRIGPHQYKSSRLDGHQDFIINEQLIDEFDALQKTQFAHVSPTVKSLIWGLFGERDTLAHFEPVFLQYYDHSYHFPGGHTPTADEVLTWYVPLIEQLIAY